MLIAQDVGGRGDNPDEASGIITIAVIAGVVLVAGLLLAAFFARSRGRARAMRRRPDVEGRMGRVPEFRGDPRHDHPSEQARREGSRGHRAMGQEPARPRVVARNAGYRRVAASDKVSDSREANSGRARELLIEELRAAVGDEAVERADLEIDRTLAPKPRSLRGAFVSSRLLLLVVGSALLVAGVIASLATESWVWFAVALAVHAVFAGLVIATAFRLTTQVEKPAPTTVTALEAEGVGDPEGALNDLVEQVADQEEGSRVKRALTQEDDTTLPDNDPPAAAAGQQSASTPASEPTKARPQR